MRGGSLGFEKSAQFLTALGSLLEFLFLRFDLGLLFLDSLSFFDHLLILLVSGNSIFMLGFSIQLELGRLSKCPNYCFGPCLTIGISVCCLFGCHTFTFVNFRFGHE